VEEQIVSTENKISNKADDLGGKAKEKIGGLTGDQDLRDEGRADQAKAAVKDAGEKVKDAAGDIGGKLKDAAEDVGDKLKHMADKAKAAVHDRNDHGHNR
jgi:uncharacterized protein YjbJ (UPF0337 family)